MTETKKREGFQGQRAIVIPAKVLARHFDNHPVVKHLHITDIGYYPNALYHHRQRSHGINQNILIYCVKGTGWAKIAEKKYILSAGDFVLLPANTPHEYAADEQTPWTIYWLHFKGTDSSDFVAMMLKRMGDHVASISFQEKRLQLFEEMYTSLERGHSTDNICYASLSLKYFLGSCCFDNNFQPINEKTDSISLCVNYLQKHIDKPLSLNDIASAVNLSVSHFASIFKKNTGFLSLNTLTI
jgi:mannose-6-phosphate isomerase-like protein (cupin superfamily)